MLKNILLLVFVLGSLISCCRVSYKLVNFHCRCEYTSISHFYYNSLSRTFWKREFNKKDSLWIRRNDYVIFTPSDCFGSMTFLERYGDTIVVGQMSGSPIIHSDSLKVSRERREYREFYLPERTGSWKLYDTTMTLIREIQMPD